jgi:hypothetical protein
MSGRQARVPGGGILHKRPLHSPKSKLTTLIRITMNTEKVGNFELHFRNKRIDFYKDDG